jgi:hypothetical protein
MADFFFSIVCADAAVVTSKRTAASRCFTFMMKDLIMIRFYNPAKMQSSLRVKNTQLYEPLLKLYEM